MTEAERGLYRYRALIGALVMLDGDRLRQIERERVRRVFESTGGLGLDPEEKRHRRAEIDGRLRQLQARRELEWRTTEGTGEIAPHADWGGEFLLRRDADLKLISEGQTPVSEIRGLIRATAEVKVDVYLHRPISSSGAGVA